MAVSGESAAVGEVAVVGGVNHVGAGGGLWLTILLAVPGYRISTTVNTLVVASDEGTSFSLYSGFGF